MLKFPPHFEERKVGENYLKLKGFHTFALPTGGRSKHEFVDE
jgi:hypothetical protein